MKYSSLVLYITISILVNYVNGNLVTTNCNDVSGYYWRDYTGEVPSDALPGGTDPKGRTTYIGQTLHPRASLLPGKISEDNPAMFYYNAAAEHSSTEDVKILCSQHPEKLQWISTESGNSSTSLGVDKTLILGGRDRSRALAIGRIIITTGELLVGRVPLEDYNFGYIYLAANGKGWAHTGPYEVLVYNPAISVDDH